MDFHAAAAHQANADERLRGAETRAKNQDVDRALHTVGCDDAVFADFRDAVRDQFHVGLCQRRIEVVRYKDAFAAQFVLGFQGRAQLWIADLLLQMMCGDLRRLAANKTVAQEAEDAKLLSPENQLPKRPHDQWEAAESLLPFFRDREIHARHDPWRSALEKKELAHTRSNLRNKLDRARTRANDGDVFAVQVDIVVPGGG